MFGKNRLRKMIAMKDCINNSKVFLICILLLPALSLCAQENLSPPLRAHHSLIYDEATKTVLLTGGSTPLNGGSSFKVYNDVWSFDGKKWTLSIRLILFNSAHDRSMDSVISFKKGAGNYHIKLSELERYKFFTFYLFALVI